MKQVLRSLAVLSLYLGIASCSSDSTSPAPTTPDPTETPSDAELTFEAVLDGKSAVPPNASKAEGSATLIFNTVSKKFTITVNYNGVEAISGHVHRGAIGENGDIVLGFSELKSPIRETSDALDAAQERELNSNLYYLNIHSIEYPAGEIRGQLIKQ